MRWELCQQLKPVLSWMLQINSIRDLWRPSEWPNEGDRKQGAVLRMYKSFGIAKALWGKHIESWASSIEADVHPASVNWQPWHSWCPRWLRCPLLVNLWGVVWVEWVEGRKGGQNWGYLISVRADHFGLSLVQGAWLSIRVRSALTSSCATPKVPSSRYIDTLNCRIYCFSNTSVDTKVLLTFWPCCSGLLQGKDSTQRECVILMPSHRIICDHCSHAICQWVSDLLGWLSPPVSSGQPPSIQGAQALLRRSSGGVIWMWMASLSSSSLGCLAMSTTVVSSHLKVWWYFNVCPVLQTFPWSHAGRPLGVLSAWSPAFSWSHQCWSCHNCRGFGTLPWVSSPLVEGPSPWSTLSRVTVQS